MCDDIIDNVAFIASLAISDLRVFEMLIIVDFGYFFKSNQRGRMHADECDYGYQVAHACLDFFHRQSYQSPWVVV